MNLFVFFALVLGFVAPNPPATSTRAVDTKASVVTWTGYKVTGKHYGKVNLVSGELTMNEGVITGGTFVIDMNSMTCDDLTGETAGKLLGHLKSDDFFGVEKFPRATLKITRAIAQDSKGNYKILANLTIKDTTKPIKFFATVTKEGGKDVATADIKVDRSEFDVRYGSGSFFDSLGDKTIYDEFDMNVRLVLN